MSILTSRLTKIWCWIVGHDWVEGPRFENPANSSQWGNSECARCRHIHSWQYDL